MTRPTLLLLGANGQVGHALQIALASLGEVVTCTRAELDLDQVAQSPDLLMALVQKLQPAAILNAAAYTAVDKAQTETERARTLNVTVPELLAKAATAVGACLVHYSTDYVFDGTKKGAYQEQDQTHPLSVYGQTKLQGELAVASGCQRHLILRTSWVVSAHGGNFLKTMLKLGQERDSLNIVSDQIGAPTSAALIAQVTLQLLQTMLDKPASDTRWGTYHLTSSGQTSWFYYAQYLLSQARAMGWPIRVLPESIQAIATADYPVAATRPLNSKLDTSKLRQTFAVVLPDWSVGVDEVLTVLKAELPKTLHASVKGPQP